jgi:hypothetical protein
MKTKKVKLAPKEPYLHTVVYKVKINYDSKSKFYFAMFLVGDGVTKVRGRFTRSWNRFFESETLEGVRDNILRNDDWKGATLSDETPLTSEIVIDVVGDSYVEDAFYSFFCVRPEYENDANREIVDVILTKYNMEKKLYTRKEQSEVTYDEIFPALKEKFNPQQVENIKTYMWHIVKTTDKTLRSMEVK